MLSTARSIVTIVLLAASGLAQSQAPIGDFTGRYTFTRDGEEVQLTLDPAPTPETDWSKPMNLTGFVTRYGLSDADKDQLFDQFFKSGSLEGHKIRFVTRPVHGVSYEFDGKVERGEAPSWAKDGYYVVGGKLTESVTDAKGKVKSRSREITMKSLANLDDEEQR
jgi:hypothetical protein